MNAVYVGHTSFFQIVDLGSDCTTSVVDLPLKNSLDFFFLPTNTGHMYTLLFLFVMVSVSENLVFMDGNRSLKKLLLRYWHGTVASILL